MPKAAVRDVLPTADKELGMQNFVREVKQKSNYKTQLFLDACTTKTLKCGQLVIPDSAVWKQKPNTEAEHQQEKTSHRLQERPLS